MHRPAVDQQPPGGELTHVGMEEAVGILARLDVACRIGDKKGVPIEHGQVAGHRPRVLNYPIGLSVVLNALRRGVLVESSFALERG